MYEVSFSSEHYKPCYRDMEFPRWNYPWDDMDKPKDFFTISSIEGEDDATLIRKAKSAVANVGRRKKHAGKEFDVRLVRSGLVMVQRIK